MHRMLLLTVVLPFLAAAAPIATLTTGGPVKVNGTLVPTAGAPTWPLVLGDEIATTTQPAMLLFADGTRVTLAQNTRVNLPKCAPPVLDTLEGTITYKMAPASKLLLCALGRPIKPERETEGSLTIEGPDKVVVRVAGKEQVQVPPGACPCEVPPAAWLTAKKVTVLVVVGAAGVAGLTYGLTRPAARSLSVQ